MVIDAVFILFLIIATIDLMIPLVLASLGEVITEKSGIVNIGLEGIMLMSALIAVYATEIFQSWIMGYLIAGLFGAFIGLIHGLISIYLNGDQIVSGIGINIIGLGFTPFMIQAIWGVSGQHGLDTNLAVPRFVLSIAEKTATISPMFIVIIILVFGTYIVFKYTNLGLIVRAAGENPEAVEVIGVDVRLVRLIATVIGAFLAGLGGAYLSIDLTKFITKNITSGRGFLALANVVFSRWDPLLVLVGGFIFGFFDALAIKADVFGFKEYVPTDFLKMTPYIATLIIVAGFIGKAKAPKALGEPYVKE